MSNVLIGSVDDVEFLIQYQGQHQKLILLVPTEKSVEFVTLVHVAVKLSDLGFARGRGEGNPPVVLLPKGLGPCLECNVLDVLRVLNTFS